MPVFGKDKGVKLSIFILSNNQVSEVVMPMIQITGGSNHNTDCEDIVEGFIANSLPNLLDCLSIEAEVVAVAAEGYGPGYTPFRHDFAAGTNPGTRAGAAVPNNVAALVTFYADADDLAGAPVKTGKTMLAGVSNSDVVMDKLVAALITALETWAADLIAGFLGSFAVNTWKRVTGTQPTLPNNLLVSFKAVVRAYLATQRRRLLPH